MQSANHAAVWLDPAPVTPRSELRLLRSENALFDRYRRDGDVAARAELIERFLPLARKLARRYGRRGEPLDDLVQVATLGLIKAIDRFEAERGTAFSSYAVPTIVGELRRHFRGTGWALHLPRDMQERVLAVGVTVDRLSASLGASPSPQQVAGDMGLTVEEVLEAMVAAEGHDTVSLDAPAYVADDDGSNASIADAVGALDERFELAERRPGLVRALRSLQVRQRTILYLRFVEDLTQSEIGRRLGISQMHVSRLTREALERLRLLVGET